MDKRDDIINIVKIYIDLVKQSNFPMQIEAAYLFGSYAKGIPKQDSDIDVALIVNNFEGDFFEIIPPIWLLREKIDYRIEPHVIARNNDFAGMIDEIQNTGIFIN
ncbi:MAG: nucleotidyltransferase domain-containing protein [Marinilabiliaceae bacterium]|nr:nucleotidyltransferase domain-containing protein [Marinilabiliaceae bacterium]